VFYIWRFNLYLGSINTSIHLLPVLREKIPKFPPQIFVSMMHLDLRSGSCCQGRNNSFLINTPPSLCVLGWEASHIWPALTSHWSRHSQTTNTSPHITLSTVTTKSLPTHYSTVETQWSLWHFGEEGTMPNERGEICHTIRLCGLDSRLQVM